MGSFLIFFLFRLYKIPKEFKDIPALAIKVELDGVSPPSNEEWSQKSLEAMTECLSNADEKIYASFLVSC